MRRLWVLVKGLPAEAATWRGRAESWTHHDELIATLVGVVERWGNVTAQVGGAKPSSLPDPVQIPRPGDGPRRRRASKQETKALFKRIFGLKRTEQQ